MPTYLYGPNAALDFDSGLPLQDTWGTIYAPSDNYFTAPLTPISMIGLPMDRVNVRNGVTESFKLEGYPTVMWKSADVDNPIVISLDAQGGDVPPGGTSGQVLTKNSEADFDTEWRAVTEYTTADTWEQVRVIVMADGTVKGIPVWAEPPVAPAKPGATPGSTLIWLSWTAVPEGRTYKLFRNGQQIYAGASLAYVDRDVQNGASYQYVVIAYDQFGQRSPESPLAVAAADASLNVAPKVQVTTWPAVLPSTGRGIIRVCASDAEGQEMLLTLSISGGTITATRDPSVWIYQA